jgi:hypothetical protein
MAEVYGVSLTSSRLRGYLESLKVLSFDELQGAYNRLLQDDRVKRFPLPGEIISAAKPALSERDEAIWRLERIKEAIRQYGWAQPEQAREWLGDVLWADVRSMGGWMYLCSSPEANLNDSTIYAQRRDQLTSRVQSSRKGLALPEEDRPVELIPGIKTVKELAEKKVMENNDSNE